MSQAPTARSTDELVARADFQYRWRVYLFFVLVFGYGLLSLRDGFFRWPRDNAEHARMRAEGKTPPQVDHNEASILINQALGVLFPAISLPLFIWLMYRSRGQYRLTHDALTAPGHPAIPLSQINALDKSLWERKGIATIEYQTAEGKIMKVSLRDMVYHRQTTDQIVDRIEAYLSGGESPARADGSAKS